MKSNAFFLKWNARGTANIPRLIIYRPGCVCLKGLASKYTLRSGPPVSLQRRVGKACNLVQHPSLPKDPLLTVNGEKRRRMTTMYIASSPRGLNIKNV